MERLSKTKTALSVEQNPKKAPQKGNVPLTIHAASDEKISQNGPRNTKCPLCTQPHYFGRCEHLKKKSVNDRKSTVSAERLCFDCLGLHDVKEIVKMKEPVVFARL